MFSQSKQDEWVLSKIPKGRYLEIGASHPIDINNTYLLELNAWDGLSIDIDPQCKEVWKLSRSNQLLITDALLFNYASFGDVDYLQLDIEPPSQTLQALKIVLNSKIKFKLLTFEHDDYTGKGCKSESRELLTSAGYTLDVADVQCEFGSYEDWWIKL